MGAIVEIRLFGPVAVLRDGVAVAMPRSRKVRALLAYLALSPQPVARSRLCDLLWDAASDPRGELRWCLSKLRAVLDDGRPRVVATDDHVALDLAGIRVDALELASGAAADLPTATLAERSERCAGDLLAGLELEDSAELGGWLAAQRNRFRALQVELLREQATRVAPPDVFAVLDRWLQLAPFDPRAHATMLSALATAGRLRDAEAHFAATVRAFEAEGIDWTSLRDAWTAARPPHVEQPAPRAAERPRRRASVAVMPFTNSGDSHVGAGLAEDVIMQLARLRVLFVIGRGSVFSLAERGVGAQDAARLLDVDYLVTGTIRGAGAQLTVRVELADARDGRIVWTDALEGVALPVLGTVVDRIVAAIAEEIETEESRRAVLRPPSTLDAWQAYHRGLWHMYKFTGPDNRTAEQLFHTAIELDPTFARAHAGLSFTHFQNAFLDLAPDRERQIAHAFDAALHSLAADDHDPAAHWAMGRALWLRGEHAESVAELQRSVELSPNFALGHYTLGFVHCQKGDPQAAIEASNYSRQLSPFDPLQFAMLASRALAHVRLDERAEAVTWAVRATARPNAHAHILAIAATCLTLVDRESEARRFVARLRARLPGYTVEDYLRAFQFDRDVEQLFRATARRIDFAG